jgi:hypothetical protein
MTQRADTPRERVAARLPHVGRIVGNTSAEGLLRHRAGHLLHALGREPFDMPVVCR